MRTYFLIIAVFMSFNSIASANSSYKDTFFNHQDHMSDKWENYVEIYEVHFAPYKEKKVDILEIGVQNGRHLQVLKKYFKHSKIYGIDINPNVCKQELGNEITTMCFDATKKTLVDDKLNNLTFDIIIDDASHKSDDVIKSFNLLFSKVKPSGIYIVEDLHTSYWKEFKGSYKCKNASIEYLKSLVDLINAYHIRPNQNVQNIDFFNKLSDFEKQLVQSIHSITFYDSVAVIKKLATPRVGPYQRVTVGTKQTVAIVK